MWSEIQSLGAEAADRNIANLFESDNRSGDFSITFGDLLFDYSKTQMTESDRDALISFAEKADVAARREAMFLSLIHI